MRGTACNALQLQEPPAPGFQHNEHRVPHCVCADVEELIAELTGALLEMVGESLLEIHNAREKTCGIADRGDRHQPNDLTMQTSRPQSADRDRG